MAGEKYIVAAADNPTQIMVRNALNPLGYIFLGNCSDPVSLIRLVRSYHPEFAVVDAELKLPVIKNTLETIDDEMLCPCIIIGESRGDIVSSLLENSKSIVFCPKPLNRELLSQTTELALMNFKRISALSSKLKEMTENFETRKSVERAKYILMNRDGMTEKDAYERMRKKSMDSRMSMKDIADAIITAHEVMGK